MANLSDKTRALLRKSKTSATVVTLFTTMALLIALVTLDGCKRKENVQPAPHWFKHYKSYQEEKYVQYIGGQIGSSQDTTLTATMVSDYYRSRDSQPFWTRNGLQEAITDTLLTALQDAYKLHGIPAEYFQLDSIRHDIDRLVKHEIPDNDELYSHLYRIERQLTEQYVHYACALHYGAVNPKTVHGRKWFYETLSPDSTFLRETLEKMPEFAAQLRELAPKSTDYQALQKEMARLTALNDSTKTEVPKFSAKKGSNNANLRMLCERLNQIGIPVKASNTLNDTLLQAINTFRHINGIPESDTLDAETIEKLNRPLQYYKDAVAANLERMRWQKRHQKSDDTLHIAVNIPDYSLCVVQKKRVVMRNKICCGRTQNPENVPARHHDGIIIPYKAETPLMYSKIHSLVLNPEWNIPYDIIKNEYYPKLVQSNTACINREHLYIRDSRNGRYVVPDSIDWKKVNRGNIPYRLHQTSGRYNALGLYKFVFANSESVYLHDTNNKGAFQRRKRALSHGCVRVENPADIAEWVYTVNRFDTNYIEQLHIISGAEPTTERGEKFLKKREEQDSIRYERLSDYDRQFYRKLQPSSITLSKPIPLFIEYYTCFVGEDGKVQYREDVYYKDGNIQYLLTHPERN